MTMTKEITFRFEASDEPECEDDQTVVLVDGEDSGYAIQHSCFGEFCLNQYFYDAQGNLSGMKPVSRHPTLALAIAAVTETLKTPA